MAIIDRSSYARALTQYNTVNENTTNVKYGTTSLDFQSGWFTTPSAAELNLTGDFTIQWWQYRTATTGAFESVLCNGQTNYNATDLKFIGVFCEDYSWPDQFMVGRGLPSNEGAGGGGLMSSATPMNAWFHMALCRFGNTLQWFINGVADTSTTVDVGWAFDLSETITYIGQQSWDGTLPLKSLIDDFQITNGVARYTSSFTPPGQLPVGVDDPYWSSVVLLLNGEAATATQRAGLVSLGVYDGQLPTGDTYDAPANSDHGLLFTTLTNDDHVQYFNETRADLAYAPIIHTQSPATLTANGAGISDMMVWDGTQWSYANLGVNEQFAYQLGQSISSTVTTLAPATGLGAYLVANGVYQIETFITFQSAASGTGINLGLTTPSGCLNMVEITVPITSTAVASQLRTIFPDADTAANAGNVLGTGVTAANSNHTAHISGIVVNGATAGDLNIVFASEVDSSTVTIEAGTTFRLTRIQ
jgi:hypothetical protein